eukprot:5979006-Pyramimonas_sp.AAC.1
MLRSSRSGSTRGPHVERRTPSAQRRSWRSAVPPLPAAAASRWCSLRSRSAARRTVRWFLRPSRPSAP